jgi:serine/threonine protein kinase
MVFEYHEFDLSGLIHLHGLSLPQIQSYMGQLLAAVSSMHSLGFVHRDLKPANVFVTRANVLKLGDFGLTKYIATDTVRPLTQEVVTPSYRAPELLLGDQHYTQAVDVWSLACVFFEMITGKRLFEPSTSSPLSVLDSIFKICGTPNSESWPGIVDLSDWGRLKLLRTYRPSLRETLVRSLPAEFASVIDLLVGMLQLRPDDRITVEQALEHPFFKEYVTVPTPKMAECHALNVTQTPKMAVRPLEVCVKARRVLAPLVLA